MTELPVHARAAIEAFADGRPIATIRSMAGNAGFSYGVEVDGRGYVVRVPPPGARPTGTADVLRQARILTYLATTDVPVPTVCGVGTSERPWSAVELVAGASVRPTESEAFEPSVTHALALAAIDTLRILHAVAPPTWLGKPVAAADTVRRWDPLRERGRVVSDPPGADALRERLLALIPRREPIAIVHGDYQWGNVLGLAGPPSPRIVAVIDWELCHVGAPMQDLGWLMLFTDRSLWPPAAGLMPAGLPAVSQLADRYGVDAGAVSWHRALAAYGFAAVIGVNLRLHREGKRPDPLWEALAPAATTLVRAAAELLG